MQSTTFRNSAGFGKRIEYWIVGRMLKDGLDVYLPLVDDHAVDAIIKTKNGTVVEIQIKARSKDAKQPALFAGVDRRPNKTGTYCYVFYSEHLDKTWILTAEEFVKESTPNKTGKHIGKRTIWFNGLKTGKAYPKEKYEQYSVENFKELDNF